MHNLIVLLVVVALGCVVEARPGHHDDSHLIPEKRIEIKLVAHGVGVYLSPSVSPSHLASASPSPSNVPQNTECVSGSSGECPDLGHGVCSSRGACCQGSFCKCAPGYTGRYCEVSTHENCPRQCSSNGRCVNGACDCNSGYSGRDCSEIIACKEHSFCSGKGTCVSNTCECHVGYAGDSCEQALECPSHCSGRGICMGGLCACDPGFSGDNCATAIAQHCPNGCSGHGTCLENSTCLCEFGFSGDSCEVTENSCNCRHGACVLHKDQPVCQCNAGTKGQYCDKFEETSAPCKESFCSGHGQCSIATDASGTCNCSQGYTGSSCAVIEHSACPQGCSGRGRCIDVMGVCECNHGYTGAACDVSLCLKTSNGVCDDHGICSNSRTQLSLVSISSSSGNNTNTQQTATNSNYHCMCDELYEGEDCSKLIVPEVPVNNCPGKCSGHGNCVDAKCECSDGWIDDSCSTYVPITDADVERPSASEFS